MKLAIFLLFIGSLVVAAPLESKDAFEKLKPLAMKSKHPTTFDSKKEFSVTLPSEKLQGDEKGEWINSHIKAFKPDGKSVNQISIETQNCNIKEAEFDKTAMQERVKELVKTVSAQIFEPAFELDAGYFKELGPYWEKTVRVKVREAHPGVRSMRISRGVSYCDSHRGYYFRYDFFL